MMRSWTVNQRIILCFSAIVAMMVALSVFAYVRLGSIENQTATLHRDSIPSLYIVGKLAAVSTETYSGVQRHLLENDPAKMQAIMAGIQQKTVERLDLLRQHEAVITTAREKELFAATIEALKPYSEVRAQVLKLSADPRTKAEASTLLSLQLEPLYGGLQAAIKAEVDLNKSAADEAGQRTEETVASTQRAILESLLVGLLLALVSGYLLVGAINRSIARVVAAVAVTRTGNQQQLSSANQLAATTLEIGATSKEISATSKGLVNTMNEVSTVAEHSAELAGIGQVGLTHMEDTMRHVMEAAASVNAKLAVLNEKAGGISQVVTTITKVADQTNLLSLNAAIEAEKAGEYGRGFAVVATEIRRLADQTAVATYDIEQMVKEIQTAVVTGVMGMDKFSEEVRRGMQAVQQVGGQLSQIILQVQALAPRVESVNEGMQAQATGAEQITEAIMQLSDTARQTVQSLRHSSDAMDDLHRVARVLSRHVGKLIAAPGPAALLGQV
jgi:methyl-accepting chemotaxis protein WspA